jgi:molybdopterin-guanine dinucleotide biosynthesis protein A
LLSISILCGGKSKRFGTNKIFHEINGKTILEIVFERFQNLSDDVFLQISNNQTNIADLSNVNSSIYHDLIENIGPLGGIYSALTHAKHEQTFIVAGDLPFVDVNIIEELKMFNSIHIIVPKWNSGFVEPLCAIYSKNILPIIERQIENKDFKISNLYKIVGQNENIKIKYIEIEDLIHQNKLNPDCFRNINTINDLDLI